MYPTPRIAMKNEGKLRANIQRMTRGPYKCAPGRAKFGPGHDRRSHSASIRRGLASDRFEKDSLRQRLMMPDPPYLGGGEWDQHSRRRRDTRPEQEANTEQADRAGERVARAPWRGRSQRSEIAMTAESRPEKLVMTQAPRSTSARLVRAEACQLAIVGSKAR